MKSKAIELSNKIKAQTPNLYAHLKELGKKTGIIITYSVDEYIEFHSHSHYVIVNMSRELPNDEYLQFTNTIYSDSKQAELKCAVGEIVITEFEYIQLMYEWEKENRKQFTKWGYEFIINDDNSVSIRRQNGKIIAIKPDCSNKITLI